MSQENVDLVRTGYEALNRSDLDGVLAMLAPDVEFLTTGLFVGQDHVYSGHDGFKKFWRDFRGTWQSLHLAINELRDCDDRVVALVTFEARGREGLEVARKTGIVYTFRDGLVTRIENHEGWAETPRSRRAAGVGDVATPPRNPLPHAWTPPPQTDQTRPRFRLRFPRERLEALPGWEWTLRHPLEHGARGRGRPIWLVPSRLPPCAP